MPTPPPTLYSAFLKRTCLVGLRGSTRRALQERRPMTAATYYRLLKRMREHPGCAPLPEVRARRSGSGRSTSGARRSGSGRSASGARRPGSGRSGSGRSASGARRSASGAGRSASGAGAKRAAIAKLLRGKKRSAADMRKQVRRIAGSVSELRAIGLSADQRRALRAYYPSL